MCSAFVWVFCVCALTDSAALCLSLRFSFVSNCRSATALCSVFFICTVVRFSAVIYTYIHISNAQRSTLSLSFPISISLSVLANNTHSHTHTQTKQQQIKSIVKYIIFRFSYGTVRAKSTTPKKYQKSVLILCVCC